MVVVAGGLEDVNWPGNKDNLESTDETEGDVAVELWQSGEGELVTAKKLFSEPSRLEGPEPGIKEPDSFGTLDEISTWFSHEEVAWEMHASTAS